jgi:hypothetical protein
MNGNTVIIILSIALLVALGLLVFGVGRFVCGIAHYYFRETKPVRQFQHPELGLLALENGIWEGTAKIDGRAIRYWLGGGDTVPDESLVKQFQQLTVRLGELELEANHFLKCREPAVREAQLDFYGLSILNERQPDDFTLEFVDVNDDSKVWRVDFVAGQPRQTGFDD